MRLSASLPGSTLGELGLILSSLALLPLTRAVSFQPAPPANLDLSQLGRVALAGNFDSISLYEYIGQNEDGLHTNGSQSLYSRFPNGQFARIDSADAYVTAMCPFVAQDGTLNGVVVVGNFTSIGGQETQAAALLDPSNGDITPLPGLNGQVAAVYCDSDSGTVYFGGTFTANNVTNAMSWTDHWASLPFAGFNGPVSAINKLPNGNLIFGGSFSGIGRNAMPNVLDAQVVNLVNANLTSSANATIQGFSDPSNIVCKTSADTGPGNNWLLPPQAPGFWQADFGFGFVPSKLRLYQSQFPGYGTKTFRFTALPINGIMNFTYVDANGQNASCTSQCPLPENNATYQDFHFVNNVGMSSFRIDISDWYGQGAGLGGIELFQNDIYSFAIEAFNEPRCDGVSQGSTVTTTGNWDVNMNENGLSSSQFLTVTLPDGTPNGTAGSQSAYQVVFMPDIKQSGNYSITVYTPGCIGDTSCDNRGIVDITGTVGTNTATSPPISTTIFQTNNYDKYDEVFSGYVDKSSDSFRPSVTLTPSPGQGGPLTVAAQRVRFILKSASSDGLNGLFEFNPDIVDQQPTDFSKSSIDAAGLSLGDGAEVTSIVVDGNDTYVAGNFTSQDILNIMVIRDGKPTGLNEQGLNSTVLSMVMKDSTLYVGGNFTATGSDNTPGVNNVASYTTSDNTWHALGSGVNGVVYNLVPLSINVSATGDTQDAIAVSGWFDTVLAFSNYSAFNVENLAIWVPSRQNWLQNLDEGGMVLSGRLTASTDVPNQPPVFAGSIDSQMFGQSGVVEVTSSDSGLNLQSLGIDIWALKPKESKVTIHKRQSASNTTAIPYDGIVTGFFYGDHGLDITALAGHFAVQASNGTTVNNLAFVNGSDSNGVTGLARNFESSSAITALDVHDRTLFAGGSTTPHIILYDLISADYSAVQPPDLQGPSAVVNAIASQPSGNAVYVGGSFTSAGSFECPALCIYDTNAQRWQNPFPSISPDSIVHAMQWASPTELIIAGSLTIGGNKTALSKWNTKTNQFEILTNSDKTPGPITTFTALDDSYKTFYVAGITSDGSPFILNFDGGETWTAVEGLASGSIVYGLQTLMLTQDHNQTRLLGNDQSILITGKLSLPGFGNASSTLFDGTNFLPFALSTLNDGTPGSIYRTFVQNPQNLLHTTSPHHLKTGYIVLIALAIALGLIFILVVIGIFTERYRRRREGYMRAPTSASPVPAYEKGKGNIGDIPAETLFSGVGSGKATPVKRSSPPRSIGKSGNGNDNGNGNGY